MSLHRNIYSFVYRGEDCPETKDVIWIHHQIKNDLQSPIVAEIWIKNEWRPLIWGINGSDGLECCCCGSPFVKEEGKASAAMRSASNRAKGDFSFVAGHKSSAFANESVAIGHGVVADTEDQVVLGSFNERSDLYKFVIGIGDSDSERKNAIAITKSGEVLFYNNIDNTFYSVAQIIQSIGRGEIITDFFVPGDIIEIIPDI